jgi:hypothetical protein
MRRILRKKKKEKEAQALESGLGRYSGLFLVSPWPLFLDQMVEAGGVRGALILSARWNFLPWSFLFACLSHTTIIDSAPSNFFNSISLSPFFSSV